MMELLLLLLPVAAASGWMAAKRSDCKGKQLYAERNPDYYKGLNFLLNEQPDKAIDVFVQMLEVDSDTVETHLALGNLFRRRGEVDRAIRIHQNLIARPTLKSDHRAQALLELGQDYMRAGLYDRAESLFQELIELNLHREQALRNLLVIYEREKEWSKSLDTAIRLEAITGEQLQNQRAHYYCELAEQAHAVADTAVASEYLKQAYACDKKSVRAAILLGEVDRAKGNHKAAIKIFKKIAENNPAYLPIVLPSLRNCYTDTNAELKFKQYLFKLYAENKGLVEAVTLTQIIRDDEGHRSAVAFLKEYLTDHLSLDGLHHLVALNLNDESMMSSEMLLLVRRLLDKLLEESPLYKCDTCGFNAKAMHWQCPSCNNWSSIKPVQISV
ncbi:MAG: lipopolysaccharide assembly protein LapB [Gammaproteobacteria bacterium]|nr:lipopolysaccharide assembly protein LapB [Gammaproteobacteria bacterium]